MRRNFAQVLKEGKVDIKKEYDKLFGMLYSKDYNGISLHDIMGQNFINFYFRGICLCIEEFDDMYNYHFEENPTDFSVETLISLCEYFDNMLIGLQSALNSWFNNNINFFLYFQQIQRVVEAIGYMEINADNFTIYVEKTPAAIEVSQSELIPKDFSYKMLSYNHQTLKGNIEGKKDILIKFASILEGKNAELHKISNSLKSDLFYAFNTLDIRHNNTDTANKKNYKKIVDEMPKDELEKWYDEIYEMCLLAILELEHVKRKPEFDALKNKIEGN